MILRRLRGKIMEELIINEPGVTREVRAVPELWGSGQHSAPSHAGCLEAQTSFHPGLQSRLGPRWVEQGGLAPSLFVQPQQLQKEKAAVNKPREGQGIEGRKGESRRESPREGRREAGLLTWKDGGRKEAGRLQSTWQSGGRSVPLPGPPSGISGPHLRIHCGPQAGPRLAYSCSILSLS